MSLFFLWSIFFTCIYRTFIRYFLNLTPWNVEQWKSGARKAWMRVDQLEWVSRNGQKELIKRKYQYSNYSQWWELLHTILSRGKHKHICVHYCSLFQVPRYNERTLGRGKAALALLIGWSKFPARPIRSSTQIWVARRRQYRISELFL